MTKPVEVIKLTPQPDGMVKTEVLTVHTNKTSSQLADHLDEKSKQQNSPVRYSPVD